MAVDEKKIILLQGEGRRVERGHLWVFSNEVKETSGNPDAGDEVSVYSAKGRFLGMALYSKSSLIRGRIYSRRRGQLCDEVFIISKMREAIAFRQSLPLMGNSHRLLHSESDGLPGLIADRFGDHVVIQILTAAMEKRREIIVKSLQNLLNPSSIIERSDVAHRELEGLQKQKSVLLGSPSQPIEFIENNIKILADLTEGQKTGYYLDQAYNRSLAIPFFKGKNVLDLFCYVGSWGITAAVNGASETLMVDSSEKALSLAQKGAEANNVLDKCSFLKSDVFEFLKKETSLTANHYNLIILDPPALAKSRKDVKNALGAYKELNLRAMRLLEKDGILISCSCSHHISTSDFHQMLTMAARDSSCDFSVIFQTSQSPDHPMNLSTPETSYLKVFFLRKRDF